MVCVSQVLDVDQESKRFVAETLKNLKPGQHGKYPPALEPILATRNSFDQRKRI